MYPRFSDGCLEFEDFKLTLGVTTVEEAKTMFLHHDFLQEFCDHFCHCELSIRTTIGLLRVRFSGPDLTADIAVFDLLEPVDLAVLLQSYPGAGDPVESGCEHNCSTHLVYSTGLVITPNPKKDKVLHLGFVSPQATEILSVFDAN